MHAGEETVRIFVEEWAPGYGSPLAFPEGEDGLDAVMVEDGDVLCAHRGHRSTEAATLAFVDGVRRVEASLYQQDEATGEMVHGVAAAYACGAVVCAPSVRPEFHEVVVGRVVIWGSGLSGALPPAAGGWSWTTESTAGVDPDAPIRALQTRMRDAEAELSKRMLSRGHLTIVDGPLSYLPRLNVPVIGFVKTHHRRLLPPEHHAQVATLEAGERCSLFRLGEDLYSCYLRLQPPPAGANPWHAVVRLELPQAIGRVNALEIADRAAAELPRFAGVAHCDPRAPQNLQPVGALEKHLRHRLGRAPLAYRAVRDAAASLRNSVPA